MHGSALAAALCYLRTTSPLLAGVPHFLVEVTPLELNDTEAGSIPSSCSTPSFVPDSTLTATSELSFSSPDGSRPLFFGGQDSYAYLPNPSYYPAAATFGTPITPTPALLWPDRPAEREPTAHGSRPLSEPSSSGRRKQRKAAHGRACESSAADVVCGASPFAAASPLVAGRIVDGVGLPHCSLQQLSSLSALYPTLDHDQCDLRPRSISAPTLNHQVGLIPSPQPQLPVSWPAPCRQHRSHTGGMRSFNSAPNVPSLLPFRPIRPASLTLQTLTTPPLHSTSGHHSTQRRLRDAASKAIDGKPGGSGDRRERVAGRTAPSASCAEAACGDQV